jgi:hypothetical protein
MLLNKTIRLFLDSIGRREEYEFYLTKFQSAGTACFALLVPDFDSLDQGAEALAFDLHFLLRLGLRPAVILCGADAEAKWALLRDNPLFEKRTFPAIGTDADRIPVFLENGLHGLEKMIPAVARRVHFIRAAGGFRFEYYYTQKENPFELTESDRTLADAASSLLAARPGTHISVTSPINLLEEIFTVKGAGTVFRRGSVIRSGGLPPAEPLLRLLNESFGRTLKDGILDQVTTAYYEENGRGAVLLEEHPQGLYLSKFAVGREARGEGLAQELWDAVCANHPAFFWRSRQGNSVNQWYDRHADGRHATGEWVVFWRGFDAEVIPALVAFCAARPPDFK